MPVLGVSFSWGFYSFAFDDDLLGFVEAGFSDFPDSFKSGVWMLFRYEQSDLGEWGSAGGARRPDLDDVWSKRNHRSVDRRPKLREDLQLQPEPNETDPNQGELLRF